MAESDVRFEVLVDGQQRCIAGIDGHGVLTLIAKWVKRNPDAEPGNEAWARQRLILSVGGHRSQTDDFVDWVKEDIAVGNEITIRILGPGEFDKPQARYDTVD